jgi:hypothetical protein
MTAHVRVVMAALALAAGAACDDDPDPGPGFTLGADFEAMPYGKAGCDNVDQQLAGRRELRLYVNGRGNIETVAHGLARYYRRHSLTFFTQAQAGRVDTGYALDTDLDALTLALIAAFPGVNFNDDKAVMADPVLWGKIQIFVANFLLRPVIEFARTHSDVGSGVTNLVLLPQLERPGGEPLLEPGESLAGLAVSPQLLAEFARTMPAEGEIWKGVDLPAGFTSMMFLGNDVIEALGVANRELEDLVVAHEFGHTCALVHTTVARNLMFPGVQVGVNDCRDRLDAAQIGTIRSTLGLAAAAGQALLAGERGERASPPARRFASADLRSLMVGTGAARARSVRLLLAPLLDPHPWQ